MKIFISRDLDPTSKFQNAFKELGGVDIHGESLLQFTIMDQPSLPYSDWIFFYSKTAIRFFFQWVENQKIPVESHLKFGCFGPATAAYLHSYNRSPHFVGSGMPADNGRWFAQNIVRGHILFVTATHSLHSLKDHVNFNCTQEEFPIYSNRPKDQIDLPEYDAVCFTSPMNVSAYYSQYPHRRHKAIFAIGSSTKRALEAVQPGDVIIPAEPSESELAKVIIGHLGL